MNKYKMQSDDLISELTGIYVSYHCIVYGNAEKNISLSTGGGNIIHHSLVTASKPHTHEFVEICFLLSGEIKHLINSSEQTLHEGDVLFLRPSDYHYFSPMKNGKCEMINIALSLDLLLGISKYLENDEFMGDMTSPPLPKIFKLTTVQIDKMAHELLSINSYQVTHPILAKLKTKVLVLNLVTKFFPVENLTVKLEESAPEWLKSLCLKMREPENLKSGIVAMTKLSPCTHEHLCKVCKKFMKKSPTEIINVIRVEEAARKLSGSDDKIYSIATDLGFRSISYFHSQFKKIYNSSPAEYRKHARVYGLIPL